MNQTIIKTFTLAFMALSLLGCSKQMELSEQSKTNIEQEVRQSFAELVKASTELDTKGYFNLIDDEKFVGLNADGTNWNSAEELRQLIEPAFNATDKVNSLEFPNVRVSVIDENTAILINEFEQTVTLKNGVSHKGAGGGTQVWSKAGGTWKLVSISASVKP